MLNGFGVAVVKEKASKAKHQQVCGYFKLRMKTKHMQLHKKVQQQKNIFKKQTGQKHNQK